LSGTFTQQTIEPVNELASWTQTLERVASRPLAFREDFPCITARHEAWWAHEGLRRPLLLAQANRRPDRPINRRLDLLADPDAWFEAKLADLKQTYWGGDSVPNIRVDFGPVAMGPLCGAKTEYGADTSWTHAFINDDWSNAPDWTIVEDNPTWQRLKQLTLRIAQHAGGRYALCTPDLGGSADVLLNARGPDLLCLDAIDRPELLCKHINALYPAWHKAFAMLYDTVMGNGAGIIHWLGIWSNRPYMIPACDFNFMIGPEEFARICLPDIERQARTVGRAVFHLDGPGAARHIDALLEVDAIDAIQFTPGEGTPSTRPWIEMFRKILSKGRSVLIITPIDEVVGLCETLGPEGVAIITNGSSEQIKEVEMQLSNRLV